MAITPFQLTDEFTMENFNDKLDEANDSFVSKSGDTMTGDLVINKGLPMLHLTQNGQSWIGALLKNASGTADYGTILADYASDGSRIDFVVCASTKMIQAAFVDASGNAIVRDILHTGNKPSGTYVGTSATQAIDTKGVGNICVIWRSDNAVFCIVTPSGALSVVTHEGAPSVAPYLWSHISFVNGVINLVDANPNYNESGATYYFQVL